MGDNKEYIPIPKTLQTASKSDPPVLRSGGYDCEFCEVCMDPCEWQETPCGWEELPCDWCEVTGECFCQYCETDCESSSQSCSESPTSVTVTQMMYCDRTYVGSSSLTQTPGYTFTPEAHVPSLPAAYASDYEFSYCDPSGSMTCPSYNFTVYYYFVKKTVTCTKYIYYDGEYVGVEYEYNLQPGGIFTPSAASHIPSHDSNYEFESCNPSSFPNGCPSTDFVVYYYFKSVQKVWVYANNTWNKAKPWVYVDGWQSAKAHIYANNKWNP